MKHEQKFALGVAVGIGAALVASGSRAPGMPSISLAASS